QQRRITWNANNWSAQASTDQTGSRYPPRATSPCRPGATFPATPHHLECQQLVRPGQYRPNRQPLSTQGDLTL
ncbi:hypothetical protein, partial [Aquitalea pelogenes]|uniref:hypothetical protein n=1 Tax=Aquitalea pelogenes TaxID=1293573 RepID=UPI001956930C